MQFFNKKKEVTYKNPETVVTFYREVETEDGIDLEPIKFVLGMIPYRQVKILERADFLDDTGIKTESRQNADGSMSDYYVDQDAYEKAKKRQIECVNLTRLALSFLQCKSQYLTFLNCTSNKESMSFLLSKLKPVDSKINQQELIDLIVADFSVILSKEEIQKLVLGSIKIQMLDQRTVSTVFEKFLENGTKKKQEGKQA